MKILKVELSFADRIGKKKKEKKKWSTFFPNFR